MADSKKTEPKITIESVEDSITARIEAADIPTEIKVQLRKADILILPRESVRDVKGLMFPVGTESLYLHLKGKENTEITVEPLVGDEEYVQFAFHSVTFIVGAFIGKAIAVPIFVKIVADYLKRLLFEKNSDDTVNFEVTIVDGPKATKVSYDGPASKFGKTMNDALARIIPQQSVLEEPKSEKNDGKKVMNAPKSREKRKKRK